MDNYLEKSDCRLCGSTDLAEVYDLGEHPVGDAYCDRDQIPDHTPTYPLELRRCGNCGNHQLSGVLAPHLLYGQYLYETETSAGLVEHFRDYARSVRSVCDLETGDLAVDIGSNSGVLLQHLKAQGMSVLGIEPASSIARAANSRGTPTWNEYFTEPVASRVSKEVGSPKLVTANNVFANIDDLRGFFSAIKSMLHQDGVIILETGYALDLLGQFVIDNIYHEHLSYFSVAPLQRFFGTIGLRIFHVERIPMKGGSLRLFVCRAGSERPESPAVAGTIQLESEMGLLDGSAARSFAIRAENLKTLIRSELETRAKDGLLTGYGAAVGVTTLLYWLEIGHLFSSLVDDNPIKQGRFSPGLHLPVTDASILTETPPRLVVNLAWRYMGLIARRNRAYLERGGQFLQILPTPWAIGTP